jgi:hypothetical protein
MTGDLTCSGCGGELAWSPAARDAVCSNCGTAAGLEPPEAGEVERRPVTGEALRSSTAYGLETQAVQCARCGASIDMEPHIGLAQCAFCGSDQLREFTDQDPMRPDGIVPFRVDEGSLDERVRRWADEAPQTPRGVADGIELTGAQGIYLPAWIFQARGRAVWEGKVEIPTGEKSVRVEDRTGSHDREFIDRLLFASSYADELTDFFYDTREIVPYDARYLAGFPAERARSSLKDAWIDCKGQFSGEFEEDCRMDGEFGETGTRLIELSVTPRWSGEGYYLGLVPLWFATFTFQGGAFRAAVNGLTGECTGDLPEDATRARLYEMIGAPGTPERRRAMGMSFLIAVFFAFFLFVLFLMVVD